MQTIIILAFPELAAKTMFKGVVSESLSTKNVANSDILVWTRAVLMLVHDFTVLLRKA